MEVKYVLAAVVVVLIVIMLHRFVCQPRGKTLYERLGGIYAIAAVVDDFSDNILKNPAVGIASPNPHLAEWSKNSSARLPGLKWMRTLWVANVSGGPYQFIPSEPGRVGKCPFSLEKTHASLQISPEEFDAVADELKKSLDKFNVPTAETAEVLGAFATHKPDVITGYNAANGLPTPVLQC
jgi:hemoglobin